jgi:membrane-associated phospholipid phosphatase
MEKQVLILYLAANLIFLNIIDFLFIEELQETGADLIVWIQHIRNDFLDYLFLFIAELSVALVVIAPIPIFLDHSIKYGYVALLTIFTSLFVDAVLKMSYANPRPYVYNADVFPVKCEAGYGDPSGHAALTSAGYLLFAYIASRNHNKVQAKFGVAVFFVLLVGFDRLYMGAHTYFQVILGWAFGSFIVLCILSYQNEILAILKRSRTDNKLFIGLCAATIILLIIPIIVLLERNTSWTEDWTENIDRVSNI